VRLDLSRPVRAFACDIDGCLAAVGHASYDLVALERLAALHRAAAHDPDVPVLTFMTGRPHSYVDAMMQVLDVHVAACFENGAGLATRHPYRAWLADGLDAGIADLRTLERMVEARPEAMFLQLGKVASATVFPRHPTREIEGLMAELQGLIDAHGLALVLDHSNDCVNVLLPGVDKAAGFHWLCRELDHEPGEVAGIGDSAGDVGWLRHCGVSFAPGNASAAVRASVGHALEAHDAAATVVAYEALVAANRRLRVGAAQG
jgi:hydroxymethylpyrimidine pyrophosphatase-like HAD family hydrolase